MATLESSHKMGELLLTLRKRRHMSLRQLQEASGISNGYLSQLERDCKRPSREVLEKLSAALHVPLGLLLSRAGYILSTAPTGGMSAIPESFLQVVKGLDPDEWVELEQFARYLSFKKAQQGATPTHTQG